MYLFYGVYSPDNYFKFFMRNKHCMCRMEGFYPQSFNFRDSKKLLILPVDSVGPNNSVCTFTSIQSEVIGYTAGAAKVLVTHPLCHGQRKPPQKRLSSAWASTEARMVCLGCCGQEEHWFGSIWWSPQSDRVGTHSPSLRRAKQLGTDDCGAAGGAGG